MNNLNNSADDNAEATGAYISASQNLPEITFKAVVLSIILTIILAASNAYLGLKVGTTISASIPAAVISMGILRFFKNSNILENNIVQTAASAGEALVAGIAFIIPALIVLHIWSDFNYLETVLIAMTGGILGVFFSVPLRRVLLADRTLPFPEGTAIGNVLKASAENVTSLKYLVQGGLFGSLISIAQMGFKTISESMAGWFHHNGMVIGMGIGFSPALIAAGYIVGIHVGVSILLGIILGWLIGVPYLSLQHTSAPVDAAATGMMLWKEQIRYIGVGTMLVGGLWTLINLIKPIIEGVHSSMSSLSAIRLGGMGSIPRTERDMPINYVLWGVAILSVPTLLLFWFYAQPLGLALGQGTHIALVLVGGVYAIFAGFVFASICGYFTGLVGTTNNPLSALTLGALMIISMLILVVLGGNNHFQIASEHAMSAAAFAIIVAAVVACAATITNDTIQDLKAGQMVGATPWKQQVMLILGVVIASLVIPLVLKLLFNAYGISGVFPRPGMDPSQMLAAPQAGAMAVVVQGVFAHNLPWTMLGTGAVIAIVCLIIDRYLRSKGGSLPVLGVGLGIYLPFDTTSALVIGAFTSYVIKRAVQKRYPAEIEGNTKRAEKGQQRGLILACGLVAGAALMGVVLAIPFAISQSTDVLRLVPESFEPTANAIGFAVTIAMLIWFYKVVCRSK